MYPYLRSKYARDAGLPGIHSNGDQDLAALYEECLSGMKRATRRYVR